MAEFLSEAWVEELDRAGVVVEDGPAFIFDQVVTDAPSGDIRYRVSVEGGRLRVRSLARSVVDGTSVAGGTSVGSGTSVEVGTSVEAGTSVAGGADATLITSFPTADALATGRCDASAAFAAGLVRFRGNAAALQAAAGALTAVAEALAAVRARTTVPAESSDGDG